MILNSTYECRVVKNKLQIHFIMSFSFGSIKSFASRVKESVSSNLDSFKSSSSSSSNVKSVKTGFSSMLQSVKESSAAVGKQIAQTAGTLLAKSVLYKEVYVSPNYFRYILESLGVFFL